MSGRSRPTASEVSRYASFSPPIANNRNAGGTQLRLYRAEVIMAAPHNTAMGIDSASSVATAVASFIAEVRLASSQFSNRTSRRTKALPSVPSRISPRTTPTPTSRATPTRNGTRSRRASEARCDRSSSFRRSARGRALVGRGAGVDRGAVALVAIRTTAVRELWPFRRPAGPATAWPNARARCARCVRDRHRSARRARRRVPDR